MQSEATSALAQPAPTESATAPARTISVGGLLSSYAALCTEYLGTISTAVTYMRCYRDDVGKARAAVDTLGPVYLKLMQDRGSLGGEFQAAVSESTKICIAALAEGKGPEELISFFEAEAEALAKLKINLKDRQDRIDIALGLASAALAESIIPSQRDRLAIFEQSLECADSWEHTSEGASALFQELMALQMFEIADLTGPEAVQAVMWWRDQFSRLAAVREQLGNIWQLFESDLSEIMVRLDLELSFGVQPETSDWVDSLLGVLDKAVEAAYVGVNGLDTTSN